MYFRFISRYVRDKFTQGLGNISNNIIITVTHDVGSDINKFWSPEIFTDSFLISLAVTTLFVL